MMITRRQMAAWSGLSLLGASASGWFPHLACAAQQSNKAYRHCILLWMSGGPSQLETFDPKPRHENGGPTQAIPTAVAGIHISEHLPQIAQWMTHLAVIRSMQTKEGDHARATGFVRTGYLPQGPIRYPSIGSLLAQQLHDPQCDLPAYVSVNPFLGISPAAFGPGFLGPAWSPLIVSAQTAQAGPAASEDDDSADGVAFEVRNLQRHRDVSQWQAEQRLELLAAMEHEFAMQRPDTPVAGHRQAYERAVRMMTSEAVRAFRLDDEPDALRDAYGRNPFGQGCLLARRLIEHGVSFVEVNLSDDRGNGGAAGWDTHTNNFRTVGGLCSVLDPAWASLLQDLNDRGLLADTLVIWMGEFGRTPRINDNVGRDHWPGGWSVVLGGAGIRGGQVYGATSDDGTTITEDPVAVPDLIATICRALQLEPTDANISNVGRPVPLADHGARAIDRLLT